jgi:hypothetical protein
MSMLRSAFVLTLAAPLFGAEAVISAPGNTLVAHEWGTFTSVAQADGSAMTWGALAGPADLPCFVFHSPSVAKFGVFAKVRMETPVIYFYSQAPTTVNAHARFPEGAFTEWYPKASGQDVRALSWNNVEVIPDADLEFPTGKGDSHYYAARQTDAAALRVGDQQEKLLFYRGIAQFEPPATGRFTSSGALSMRGVGQAILFENRAGKIGYRLVRGTAPVDPPELMADVASLKASLVDMLTEAGLYQKEAHAMVETWRDAWFEEGTRLLYLVPRDFVDRVLPLTITPRPRELARVFVGRVELLPPDRRKALEAAFKAGDLSHLERYGRFVNAFTDQIQEVCPPEVSRFLKDKQSVSLLQAQGQCVP